MSAKKQPPATLEEALTRIGELEGELASERTGRRLEGIAVRHVRPERLRFAMDDLRRHASKLTPQELKKLDDDKHVETFFRGFVQEHPEFAREVPGSAPGTPAAAGQGPGVASPAPASKPRPRVLAGSGRAAPSTPHAQSYPTPAPRVTTKTTKKELKAELKKRGLRGWG